MKEERKLKVRLISFGYKHGQPAEANVLFDVRFLPNPYWVEEMRARTGMETEVSDYVIGSREAQNFLKLIKPLLLFLVQQNSACGREELKIAIGCTGGRHRSVAIVEVLLDLLRVMPVQLEREHRDIKKDS